MDPHAKSDQGPRHDSGQGAGATQQLSEVEAGANTVTAELTRLRYTCPIGKRFFLDNAGRLQKVETSASRPQAVAHIVKCSTIGQVEAAFLGASESDIFVVGVPYADGLPVVSKAMRSERSIARTV